MFGNIVMSTIGILIDADYLEQGIEELELEANQGNA